MDGAAEAGLQRAAHAPRQERRLGRGVSVPAPPPLPAPTGRPGRPASGSSVGYTAPQIGETENLYPQALDASETQKGVGVADAFATLGRVRGPHARCRQRTELRFLCPRGPWTRHPTVRAEAWKAARHTALWPSPQTSPGPAKPWSWARFQGPRLHVSWLPSRCHSESKRS